MSRFEERHRRNASRRHTVPDHKPSRGIEVSVGIIADLTPSTPEQLDLARRYLARIDALDLADMIGVAP